MRITELFDNKYYWIRIRNSKYKVSFMFSTETNNKYGVNFFRNYYDNVWNIEFFMWWKDNNSNKPQITHKITNTGDQFKIFATIIDIILSFNNTHQGASFKFTANPSEPSRIKLYTRMYNTLTKKYNMHNVIFDMNPVATDDTNHRKK